MSELDASLSGAAGSSSDAAKALAAAEAKLQNVVAERTRKVRGGGGVRLWGWHENVMIQRCKVLLVWCLRCVCKRSIAQGALLHLHACHTCMWVDRLYSENA